MSLFGDMGKFFASLTPSETAYGWQGDNIQTAVLYDLLSEGEIEGLKHGEGSIYLNGTPLVNETAAPKFLNVFGEANGSGTSITLSNIRYSSYPLGALSDISLEGGRELWIERAKTGVGTFSGFQYFTSSTEFFSAADIGKDLLVILDGSPFFTSIVAYNGLTQVTTSRAIPPKYKAGANKTFYLSAKAKITSISGSTLTLSSSVGSTVQANSPARILPNVNTLSTIRNFVNVGAIFRTGSLAQPIADTAFGGNGTSFAYSSGVELRQASRIGFSGDAGAVTGAEATVISSGTMNIVEPSIIDKIKVVITFPSLTRTSKETGSKYYGAAEFQIYFRYTRGNNTYNSDGLATSSNDAQPLFGHSDTRILNRVPFPNTLDSNKAVNHWVWDNLQGNTGVVSARKEAQFIKEFYFDIEKYQPFDSFSIVIKRVDAVNDGRRKKDMVTNQSFLQSIFCYSNDKLNYPHSAYGGVRVVSSDFDSVPLRSYLVQGVKIQVPTNYYTAKEAGGVALYNRNVTTGAPVMGIAQKWDGKFRGDISDVAWREDPAHPNYNKVYCNNPAWVYYDLMVNNRYGLGEFLKAQDIDKYSLYTIARYCDELVPDGKGGQEPRFSCNLYLTSPTEAFKVLSDMASIFRGILQWSGGSIGASQDSVKVPVYTFTQANVIDGTFVYESSSKRQRANQVNVTWNNPDLFYQQDVEIVDDAESIAEEGYINKRDIVAIGTTSRGQAQRLGRWMLLTERMETSLVKFRTALVGSALSVGDIVYVQDQIKTNAIAAGRVQRGSGSTSIIYLDRGIPLESDVYKVHVAYSGGSAYLQDPSATISGVLYIQGDLISSGKEATTGNTVAVTSEEIAFNLVDDSGALLNVYWSGDTRVETREFTATAGYVTSITVTTPFSAAPDQDAMWTITKPYDLNEAKGAKKYRIISKSETDWFYDILALEYLEEKFAAIDRGYPITEPTYRTLPSFQDGEVPVPENLRAEISPLSIEGSDSASETYEAIITWTAPQLNGETYQYFSSYEVKHNFTADVSDVSVYNYGPSGMSVPFDVRSPTYSVSVRTNNILGRKSQWVTIQVVTPLAYLDIENSPIIGGLASGGRLDAQIEVSGAGLVAVTAPVDFSVQSPLGIQTTASPAVVDFSTMVDEAYLLYVGGLFIPAYRQVDTTAIDPGKGAAGAPYNFSYWKELGDITDGLTSVGTINADVVLTQSIGGVTYSVFPNQISTSADYSASFTPNDIIKLHTGAGAWYGFVQSVSTNSITVFPSINKAFSSGTAIYKQTLDVDYFADFVVSRINKVGLVYSTYNYATLSGTTGIDAVVISIRGSNIIEHVTGVDDKTVTAIAADLVRPDGIVDPQELTYKWYDTNGSVQISQSTSGYATKYATKNTAAGTSPTAIYGDATGTGVPILGAGNSNNTLVIHESAVINIAAFKVEITDSEAKTWVAYFTVYDVSDPYKVVILSSSGDRFRNALGQTTLTPSVFYGTALVADTSTWTFNWYIYDRVGVRNAFVNQDILEGGKLISSHTTTSFVVPSGGTFPTVGSLVKAVKVDGTAKFYQVTGAGPTFVDITATGTGDNTWITGLFLAPTSEEFAGGLLFGCTASGGIRTGATITVDADDVDFKARILCEANKP